MSTQAVHTVVHKGRTYKWCWLCERRYALSTDDFRHLGSVWCMLGSVARIYHARGWVKCGDAWAVCRAVRVPTERVPSYASQVVDSADPFASPFREQWWAPEWAVRVGDLRVWGSDTRKWWLTKLLNDPAAAEAALAVWRLAGPDHSERYSALVAHLLTTLPPLSFGEMANDVREDRLRRERTLRAASAGPRSQSTPAAGPRPRSRSTASRSP